MDVVKHNKVIVGFDGSDASVAALRWAAGEASRRGASVSVVASFATPAAVNFGIGYGGAAAAVATEELAEWIRTELTKAVHAAFADHRSVGYDFHAVGTRPGAALRDAAENADLLVVGRSGAGAMDRLLLGSVTAELLAHSPCPLVIAPDQLREPTGIIVVGTDGSHHAERAVRWAVDEADQRGCRLIVAHCWKAPYRLTSEGVDHSDGMRPVDAEILLDKAVQAARAISGGEIEHRLIEGGTTQSLLDLSEAADLVVVGSRGRGGFASMLFGSVTHAMASHASCPTVIVH